MLCLQRDPATAHQVHSTVAHAVKPGEVHTVPEVLEYLEGQVNMYWRAATCGDGLCEAPFEFASYGRFGCSVDCGFLQDSVDTQHVQVCPSACTHWPCACVRVQGYWLLVYAACLVCWAAGLCTDSSAGRYLSLIHI